MVLLLLILLLLSPVIHIYFLIKRHNVKTRYSIAKITIIMMLATLALSTTTSLIYLYTLNPNPAIHCDMTIPGIFGINMMLVFIIFPLFAIVARIFQKPEERKIITDNPYKDMLQNSYDQNLQ